MRVELTMHGTMSIDKGSGKETILRRKRMDINTSVACSSVISRGTNLLRAGRGNYFLSSKLSEMNYTVELEKTFSMDIIFEGKRREIISKRNRNLPNFGDRALDKSIGWPEDKLIAAIFLPLRFV